MNRARPFRFGKLLLASAVVTGLSIGGLAQADTFDDIKAKSSVRIGYANETPFAYTHFHDGCRNQDVHTAF